MEDLHVVTENGEQCFMWRANQLTYIAQERQELPKVLADRFGKLATKLDLSYNCLTSFENINSFSNLSELILDNNCLRDEQLDFKQNLRLKTLSLNKNKLADLCKLVDQVKVCFPNLEYLSLMGNPLCPNELVVCLQWAGERDNQSNEASNNDDGYAESNGGGTVNVAAAAQLQLDQTGRQTISETWTRQNDLQSSYQKYRHFIIYHLPNLRFLDSTQVCEAERNEALRRCFWMDRTARFGRPRNQLLAATAAAADNANCDESDEVCCGQSAADANGRRQLVAAAATTPFGRVAGEGAWPPASAAAAASQQPKGQFWRRFSCAACDIGTGQEGARRFRSRGTGQSGRSKPPRKDSVSRLRR